MKNIMVAIDFSKNIAHLIRYASDMAERFEAKVWLIHVAAPQPDFVGYEVGPQYIRDSVADNLREEHKKLQAVAVELRNKGIDAEGLLIQGPTVEMILEHAEKLKIDLLVAGTQEHGLMHRLLLGSTSLQLFNKAKIPLLTVPDEGNAEVS